MNLIKSFRNVTTSLVNQAREGIREEGVLKATFGSVAFVGVLAGLAGTFGMPISMISEQVTNNFDLTMKLHSIAANTAIIGFGSAAISGAAYATTNAIQKSFNSPAP